MSKRFTFECEISIEAEDLVQAIDKFHTNTEDLEWTDEVIATRIQGHEADGVNEAYLKWHKS